MKDSRLYGVSVEHSSMARRNRDYMQITGRALTSSEMKLLYLETPTRFKTFKEVADVILGVGEYPELTEYLKERGVLKGEK